MRRSFRALALVLVAGCNRAPAGPVMEPLTQSYGTANGLVTLHYPAGFAAVAQSPDRVQLNRTLPVDAALSFSAFETPISPDVNEFARVGLDAIAHTFTGYQEVNRGPGVCAGVPCVEVFGTLRGDAGTPMMWKGRAFVRNGHGYIFFYVLPQADVPAWAPLLQSILDATTFNR